MCSGMETRKEVVLEVKRLNGYGFIFLSSLLKKGGSWRKKGSEDSLRAQSELKWCLITLFIPCV